MVAESIWVVMVDSDEEVKETVDCHMKEAGGQKVVVVGASFGVVSAWKEEEPEETVVEVEVDKVEDSVDGEMVVYCGMEEVNHTILEEVAEGTHTPSSCRVQTFPLPPLQMRDHHPFVQRSSPRAHAKLPKIKASSPPCSFGRCESEGS